MKNLSLIINAVLAIAVGVLYFLHFSSGKSTPVEELTVQKEIMDADDIAEDVLSIVSAQNKIYFVNTDSLWDNFELIKKVESDLKLEKMKLEGQFKTRLEAFERDYMDLQKRVNNGTITVDEAQRKENELMNTQEKLTNLKDDLSMKLMDKEMEMNEKIQSAIYEYLEKYQKEKGLDYVLGYTKASGAVLFGRDSLDITGEVLKGLNKEYQKKNPKK